VSRVEAWLRGPVAGVDARLQPAAHALLNGLDDFETALGERASADVWAAPGGGASVAYHVRHAIGALDRLLTYARGATLDEQQRAALKAESTTPEPRPDAATLLADVRTAIERAIDVLRATDPGSLEDARAVGRAQLPSTVAGLLFHAAEHTARHAGQAITTAKFVAQSPAITGSGREE
jgi:uncharacterized damage-inducible protein DinB